MIIIELRIRYPLKQCLKVFKVIMNQYYYWKDKIKEPDADKKIKDKRKNKRDNIKISVLWIKEGICDDKG